jgi:hypothetical protein
VCGEAAVGEAIEGRADGDGKRQQADSEHDPL